MIRVKLIGFLFFLLFSFGETLSIKISNFTYNLVRIEPGTFMMGSAPTEDGRTESEKEHKVTISKPFYIGESEIPQNIFKSVMGHNPSAFIGDLRPTEYVSWNDCYDFCEKLSNKLKLPIRLPTEAEWEYACRAGELAAYNNGTYKLGKEDANFNSLIYKTVFRHNPGVYSAIEKEVIGGEFIQETTNIMSYPPNKWGLYDMHGNVSEWCLDSFDEYPDELTIDPVVTEPRRLKVFRGGSWKYNKFSLRSATRGREQLNHKDDTIGFRIVICITN